MAVIADNCPDINVYVVDTNKEKINLWNSNDFSKLPVFEPKLDKLIARCRNKNLFFSCDVNHCISISDIVFISVNTPTKTKGFGAGEASDLKWVEASARQVAKYSKNHASSRK